MATYRAFRTDLLGKVQRGEWLAARCDRDAKLEAVALCDPGTRSVALWQGARLVSTHIC